MLAGVFPVHRGYTAVVAISVVSVAVAVVPDAAVATDSIATAAANTAIIADIRNQDKLNLLLQVALLLAKGA